MSVTWWLTSRGSEANTRAAPPSPSSFLCAYFSPPLVYYTPVAQKFSNECHDIFTPFHCSTEKLKNAIITKLSITFILIGLFFYPSLSAKPIVDNLIIFLLIGYREKTASFVTRATSIDRIIVLRSKTLRFESPSSPTSSLDSLSMVTVRDSFYTDRYRSLVSPLLLLQISYRNVCVQA